MFNPNYPQTREEFYRVMNKNIDDINSMNISEELKNALLSQCEEVIENYEKGERDNIWQVQKNLSRNLEVVGENMAAVVSSIGKISKGLPALETIAQTKRIERNLKKQHYEN